MNAQRRANREYRYNWEWFRYSQYAQIYNPNADKAYATCLTRILHESAVSNCLHYQSGFGFLSRILADSGQSIIGIDSSASAVHGAQVITENSGTPNIRFFQSDNKPLPEIIPHKVAAVFSRELLYEENWHTLKDEFIQIYNTLLPGGILIFEGPNEHIPFAAKVISEYDAGPDENLKWSFRDGRIQCSRVFVKHAAGADYRDYKDLYIISEGNSTRLESTTNRIPGYWNIHNIRNLTQDTGFSHFEVRIFDNVPQEITLNIAYKHGELPLQNQQYSEEEVYNDF